jgi:hypothetical protein
MVFKGLLEIIPSDLMPGLLHGLEMFTPHRGLTSKLQDCKVGLAFL